MPKSGYGPAGSRTRHRPAAPVTLFLLTNIYFHLINLIFPYASYSLPSDQSCFVVRPDGVVGARVHEVDGVERYFQKIFS